MSDTEYLMSSKANREHLMNSIEQYMDSYTNDDSAELPPMLLANLIEWMRNKGISDEDIVECILFICK